MRLPIRAGVLILIAALAFGYSAQVRAESVATNPAWTALMSRLSAAAEENPAMIHFSFHEGAPSALSPAVDCTRATSQQISDFILQTATYLLDDDGCDAACSEGVDQLRRITSNRTFIRCREISDSAYTYTEITRFIAEDPAYELTFELGYAD